MPGTLTILSVAVPLFAVFFTSTLASHALEVFVGLINSRGNQMRRRLEGAPGPEVAGEIYDSTLIKSLAGREDGVASTIVEAAYGLLGKPRLASGIYRSGLPAYIEPAFFARSVAELFRTEGTATRACPSFQQLSGETGGDGAEFRDKIVEWFKALSDRRNGTYTRWSSWRLLLIGLFFEVVMDIDTVHIGASLWDEPRLAATLADELGKTLALSSDPDAPPTIDEAALRTAVATALPRIVRDEAEATPAYAWRSVPRDAGGRAAKVLCWLLTALATSLGAQFWFDLLSDALKLRAAGTRPVADETPREASPQPSGK